MTSPIRRPGALRAARQRGRGDHAQPARADERLGRRPRGRVLPCIDRAEADPDVRVIVVTGAGGRSARAPTWAICRRSSGAGDTRATPTSPRWSANVIRTSSPTLRKPVIAAINGACAGIGLTQALMCDVRFAAAGAKFTTVVRAPRADRRVRHLLDTSARRRLGRRARPAAERPHLPRRGGGGTRAGQGGRAARRADAARDRPTPRTSPRTARRVRWR